MTFNLLDEPWILAQRDDGPTEVSLLDAFRQSAQIRALTGEVPTQAFAILRLMLAICQDAFQIHSNDTLLDLRDEGLGLGVIEDYLARHRDRFDLFHPSQPFMQVADLRTAKGEHSDLSKIIADVPNGQQFFTTRAGSGLDRISAAEAARWLVHVQAFDPSGIRSGAVGDPLAKNGKGYPIGPSWAGQLGGVVLHGPHLDRTLLNNLVSTEGKPDDHPFWVDPPQTQLRVEDSVAPGPVSALVWQSRRVRLVGDRSGVHGVVLSLGDQVTPQQMRGLEAMTGWRYSRPQSKKFGRDVYMPNEHDPDRALWRGLPAIVAAGVQKLEDGSTVSSFLAPMTYEQLNAEENPFVLQIIGIQYGPQSATIEEIIDDRIELHGSLLGDDAWPIRTAIHDAVATSETCVRALGQLAASIARAAGEKGDGAGDADRQRAMARAWAALDQPARVWVGSLTAASDPQESKRDWQRHLDAMLRALGQELVDRAGPAAVRGRDTSFGFMSAHRAYSFFVRDLRKTLTLVRPAPKEGTAS
ncbi:type I-E CRISPR-associated protein Cse1/CasA [Mariniluteicoccus endophyticus]